MEAQAKMPTSKNKRETEQKQMHKQKKNTCTNKRTVAENKRTLILPISLAPAVKEKFAVGSFGVEKPPRESGITRTRIVLHVTSDRDRRKGAMSLELHGPELSCM